jgi:hypothetical protein
MSPRKVRVAQDRTLDLAKQLPKGKGWRLVAPGQTHARRAILMKKFKIADKTIAIFHILPGTR